MSGGGLSEFVGLGITIALTDLFTEGAEKIVEKFEHLAEGAGHGAHAVHEAISQIKMGIATMGAGAAMVAPLVAFGEKAAEIADKLHDMREAYAALTPAGRGALP
jgi:hypothetical protein